jgi:tetratricopeptide (TPR) repeat protein
MATITELLQVAAKQQAGGETELANQIYAQCLQLIDKAISAGKPSAELYNTQGLILESSGKNEQALESYRKAMELKPELAEAHHNAAIVLVAMVRFAEAETECRAAIDVNSSDPMVHNTLGYSLWKQSKYDRAIESCRRAIELKNDFAEAYNHLGVALNATGRCDEAIASYQSAIKLEPDFADAHNNMAIALRATGRLDEAIESYNRCIEIEDDFVEAYFNLANALRDEARCAEAIKNYDRAIELKPDYADAYWNKSLALLLSGNLKEGFDLYRWRKKTYHKLTAVKHEYKKDRWDGGDIAGKRLFVHCEQGFGDNIQFARYLPMVKKLGGTVIFESPKQLAGLLKNFDGIDELVELSPGGGYDIEFDRYCSLLDMPGLLGTTLETIPAESHYLYADAKKTEYWRDRIACNKFKIGIAWSGNPTHRNDPNRSCQPDYFTRFAQIDGVKLFSLQKGRSEAEDILAKKMDFVNLGDEFVDFSDTAGAMENLDLVISVDTSTLHLAGAMGKMAWGLLPFAPDWRWMLDRNDSPWYPSVKLFRQSKARQWEEVFDTVCKEVHKLISD